MAALNDAEIRDPLKLWIYENRDPKILIDELSVREGLARADLAGLFSYIHGYEIKGETDKLVRLKSQIRWYGQVMRKMTLVTTPNHVDAALKKIPKWWGVIVVDWFHRGFDSSMTIVGDVTFRIVREEGENPETLQSHHLLLMLWKREMVAFLEEQKVKVVSKDTKATLTGKIVDHVGEGGIETLVADLLLKRCQAGDRYWDEAHLRPIMV